MNRDGTGPYNNYINCRSQANEDYQTREGVRGFGNDGVRWGGGRHGRRGRGNGGGMFCGMRRGNGRGYNFRRTNNFDQPINSTNELTSLKQTITSIMNQLKDLEKLVLEHGK